MSNLKHRAPASDEKPDAPKQPSREVPTLSEEEEALFGGFTAQNGYTLAAAVDMYRRVVPRHMKD